MPRIFVEKNTVILDKGDDIDCFIIVENGLLEFRTKFDGNHFTL